MNPERAKLHGIDRCSLWEYAKNAPLFIIALIAILTVFDLGFERAQSWYHRQQTHEFWGQYEYVEPVERKFLLGQPLRMVSSTENYRPAKIEWDDILYCRRPGKEYEYFDSVEDSRTVTEPRKKNRYVWRWNGLKPAYKSECYMQHIITYTDLETGVSRVEVIADPENSFWLNYDL